MPQRAEHHESPLVLEVERFEHVPAGAERVLLRIDGRYGDRPGKRVLDAMLFVDDGLAVHRHAPVSNGAADVDSWLWRAAFDVPVAYLTDERTRFALESRPGCLVELPHPDDLLHARGAVPLTARAAHVARRYAVAIAVMLTVAVTPGGVPASARTEILRVHNPDGSVVYVTRDGQTVAELPADAVILDEQPAAPPAEPAAPQPAAPQSTPAPPAKWEDKHAAGGVTGVADATPKQRKQPKPKSEPAKPQPRRSHSAPVQPQTPTQSAPAPQQPKPKPKPKKHRRHPHHVTHQNVQAQAQAPLADQSLEQMPALLAAPGNDDVQLQSLDRVSATAHGATTSRDVQTSALPGKDLQALAHLGAAGQTVAPPSTSIPTVDTAPPLVPITPSGDEPQSTDGRKQHRTRDHRHATPPAPATPAPAKPKAPLQHSDGTPTTSNPTFVDALPGPAQPGAVPDFVISKFRVPPFLLPIYQAAGIQYGIRWEVLAAINEIETDYGRNLNVSSAGALGWMQFMPATWQMYGTDANHDKKKDPFNPVDAIFAAARYLKAAGGDKDIRRAIFAYNHAGWYVDSVMLRARLVAGYPPDLIGSLTGLTEGRFPVAAHAKYAEAPGKRNIDIYTRNQAPVVAVNDGIVKKISRSKSKGRYVVLQDVYGNQYTYSHLGAVASLYPVPKKDAKAASKANVKAVGANDPKPTTAASAGSQRPGQPADRRGRTVKPPHHAKAATPAPAATPAKVVAVKKRFFAHPQRPEPQKHGGFEQVLDTQAKGFETYDSYFTRPLGLNSRNATLRRLKKGAHVLASTVLGRVADRRGKKAPHLRFEIRPAGAGAPKIDPKPIVDGWKLLESTAIYRAKGRNALYGDGNYSIGETMLLPKPLLAKRVLSDPRINIYPAGRQDIQTGQIDRRVLVVLEYLAESGLNPTVSCLKSGHDLHTASGNISEHSSGNAVDISAINGTPILGHQEPGGVTDQAVRRLMLLQGTMQPHQIISLLDLGGNTMALPDHANHIHVGFHPLFGDNKQLGREAMSVLEPRQWDNLVQRLGKIENPTVSTKPSKYAIPDRKGDL